MLPSSLLVLAGPGILTVSATATVVLERARSLPAGWRFGGAANGNESVSLSIALRQPGIAELRTIMEHIARTGQHLSRAQLLSYQQPGTGAESAVLRWLEASGIHNAQAHDAWVSFDTTVQKADSMFETSLAFYAYGHDDPVLRSRVYSIPSVLQDDIDFVYPLTLFMARERSGPQPVDIARRRQHARSPKVANDSAPCALEVNPSCLKQLYAWNYTVPSMTETPSPARFAIAGFLDEFINYQDVSAFLSAYAPDIAQQDPAYNFTVDLVANGTNPQDPRWQAGMEASLDVQYAMAMGYPSRITYVSTGGRATKLNPSGVPFPSEASDNEPYLELLEHLVALPDDSVPHVLSISYADDEQTVPRPYAYRVSDLFLQLAARGTTVLAASGDGGSRGTGQNLCLSNDGAQRPMLIPTFPASCPWVTAVGATSNSPASLAAEYSAGGFSNYFARPAWQADAAGAYTRALNSSKTGLYNASGRGIPDLAAVGSQFEVVWGGGKSNLMGTSASTPVVAAMVAVVNDARLRAGKPSLGWLNPTLYSAGFKGVLQDIVDGVSNKCSFNRTHSEPGWPAAEGWDCVTGLGVPNDFSTFLAALTGAPSGQTGNPGVE